MLLLHGYNCQPPIRREKSVYIFISKYFEGQTYVSMSVQGA